MTHIEDGFERLIEPVTDAVFVSYHDVQFNVDLALIYTTARLKGTHTIHTTSLFEINIAFQNPARFGLPQRTRLHRRHQLIHSNPLFTA